MPRPRRASRLLRRPPGCSHAFGHERLQRLDLGAAARAMPISASVLRQAFEDHEDQHDARGDEKRPSSRKNYVMG